MNATNTESRLVRRRIVIDHTDRFRAAACSLYPVINWYSWVLTSDLPSFGAQYWFSGNPWAYTDDYMKRSVISLVKNVKTPIFADDRR